MHLYPQRRNVAAQVAEELKTVTYAAPPMEERRKKEKWQDMQHGNLAASSTSEHWLGDTSWWTVDPTPIRK